MSENLSRRSFLAVLAVTAFAWAQPAAAQDGRSVKTFIALGDSVAFGATDVLPVSYGDQGYVRPYTDWLSTQFDGVRPNVVNLGIFGETSSSFFSGVTSPYWPFRYPETNLNYTESGVAQFAKFLETVEAEKSARHDVKVVSFALGANDLFALTQTPEWNAPGADPFALLEPVLMEVEANYVRLLDALRAELPHAKVLLPNYYNAYEVLGPYHPTNILYEYVVLRHDEMVQRLAAEYRAHRVDIHSALQGRALEYTNIIFGNIHPTPLGYEVIAQAMIAASNDQASAGGATPVGGRFKTSGRRGPSSIGIVRRTPIASLTSRVGASVREDVRRRRPFDRQSFGAPASSSRDRHCSSQ